MTDTTMTTDTRLQAIRARAEKAIDGKLGGVISAWDHKDDIDWLLARLERAEALTTALEALCEGCCDKGALPLVVSARAALRDWRGE